MAICVECKEEDAEFSPNATICKPCRRIKYRKIRPCAICHVDLELYNKTGYCKACKSQYDKEYKTQKRKQYKQWLVQKGGCCACPEDHPDCLEVHHLWKGAKRFSGSRSQGSGYNIQDIELGSAIILCANCHLHFHSFFGGRSGDFPSQTKESTIEIIKLNKSRRIGT